LLRWKLKQFRQYHNGYVYKQCATNPFSPQAVTSCYEKITPSISFLDSTWTHSTYG